MDWRNAGNFFAADEAVPSATALPSQLQRVIETEHRWREQIRALPIEAKLQILTEMQRWAQAIRVATGRPPNPVWDIERR
jgi:hypothetical protein